jgi:hypothetical protein
MFRADSEPETLQQTPRSGHKCARCHGCEHEPVLTSVSKTAALRQTCAELNYLSLYSPLFMELGRFSSFIILYTQSVGAGVA